MRARACVRACVCKHDRTMRVNSIAPRRSHERSATTSTPARRRTVSGTEGPLAALAVDRSHRRVGPTGFKGMRYLFTSHAWLVALPPPARRELLLREQPWQPEWRTRARWRNDADAMEGRRWRNIPRACPQQRTCSVQCRVCDVTTSTVRNVSVEHTPRNVQHARASDA